MDQLPRLRKRELICLLLFTCNCVVSVRRSFLFLRVLGMGCVIFLWHSLSLSYNYFTGVKSAFTVTNPAAGPTSNTIKFSRIVANIGGHYDTLSGKFTCQNPGIYAFHLHIYKDSGDKDTYCHIRKNEVDMVKATAKVNDNTASSFIGSSNSVILYLDLGDIVDLGVCTGIDTFHRGWETSFSGFLIQLD